MAVTAACMRRYPGMPRDGQEWRERPRRLDWSRLLGALLMVLVVCYVAAVGAQCLNSWIDRAPPEDAQLLLVRLRLVDATP